MADMARTVETRHGGAIGRTTDGPICGAPIQRALRWRARLWLPELLEQPIRGRIGVELMRGHRPKDSVGPRGVRRIAESGADSITDQ